ncbi:glycosyltransferase family 2 protein [Glycomyces artemisiae]|uniref:Glycosyltransferase involved in cell wall biosynthesis n=1 Tax=Glycomyces artemisiae TaxID=1076443 RepID=A0A2T0UMD6_9ACTN|nr:glycosyltransferase family A protein [Glycomyces artemisiae]PRY59064.1 glycosyltransferase involved in cell wall biosynthesis [Glycomyces artemisiae]
MTSTASRTPVTAPATVPVLDGLDPESAALLLREARSQSVQALYATTIRTRSDLAVRIAARLVSPAHDREALLAVADDPTADTSEIDAARLAGYAAALSRRREYRDAYALFGLAERLDPGAIVAEFQVRYAEAALAVTGSAAGVLERFDGMVPRWRHAFEADEVHPDRGGDEAAWLERFRVLAGMPDLEVAEGDGVRFDRLGAGPAAPVRTQRRISVVMTCFKPDETLFTAVNSVVAQSWQNWELLLVDDASGPEYGEILARAAALDERIRLFRLPENSGTYKARNRALMEAKGVFTTGLDSDDWAHPRWLERQVAPMLADPALVMTFANCIRVREDLTAVHTGRPVQGPRSTSVMFRTEPVRERMGYFDALRKGADTEFHFRFKAVFGNRAVRKLQGEVFTLVRLAGDTLTSREIDNGWQHPSRSAYQSAHQHWRERIRRGQSSGFIEADQVERELYAPSLSRGIRLDGREFDELYVLDCRFWEDGQQRALDLVREAAGAGKRVGIAHVESLLRLRDELRHLRPEILDFLNESSHGPNPVEFVAPVDKVAAVRLVVTDPSLWEGRSDEFAFTETGRVEMWERTITPTAAVKTALVKQKGAKRSGESKESRPDGKGPRRVLAGAFGAVLVLLWAAAAASWFVAGADAAAALTFIALSASGGTAVAALSSAGFARFKALLRRAARR